MLKATVDSPRWDYTKALDASASIHALALATKNIQTRKEINENGCILY